MKRINYKEKKYDALLCLNGEISDDYVFESFSHLPVVCADGGANYLLGKDLVPDYIIGDIDSLESDSFEGAMIEDKIIYIKCQNSSDFEKALDFCIEKKYQRLLVLGFHGGLLEHSFNNLSVLLSYLDKLDISVLEHGRVSFILSESAEIKTEVGETVSLIPLPKCKLKTEGLRWNLHSEYLEMGKRSGARNQSISNLVKLEILEGAILVVCEF